MVDPVSAAPTVVAVGPEMLWAYMALFMFLGLVIGLAGIYIWKLVMNKKWMYDMTVFEKRNNGLWVVHDKARKIERKDGTIAFALKNEKREIKPIRYENIITAGKRGFIMVYSPNRDEYFAMLVKEKPLTVEEMESMMKRFQEVGIPMTVNANLESGEITVVDDDQKNWLALENRHAEESWTGELGFMEKYGTYIAVFVPCLLIIIGMYLMSGQLASTAAALNGVTTQLSQLVQMLTSQGIKVTASAATTTTNPISGITGGLIPAPA